MSRTRHAVIIAFLGFAAACSSSVRVYKVTPVGQPSRMDSGRTVLQQRAGDLEVELASDPVGTVPLCVALRVTNLGTERIRIDPRRFEARDLAESTRRYNEKLNAWLEYRKHNPHTSRDRPEFAAAVILDPEAELARAEATGQRSAELATYREAWANLSWFAGSGNSQLLAARSAEAARRRQGEATKLSATIRSSWLRVTDLDPGRNVVGLVCAKLDMTYATGVTFRLPLGSHTVEASYELERRR